MTPGDEPRPVKKPRLELPDGFAKTSSLPKKVAPLNFVSAFDTRPPATKSKKKPNESARTSDLPRPPKPAIVPGNGGTVSIKPSDMRVLRPPIPLALNPAKDDKNMSSITSRRPLLIPQKGTNALLKSITSLQPRPITPPMTKKVQPLSSMVPPRLAGPSRPPASDLKTIFTTNVALATDIWSESGQAEVFSLYLQQYGHGFVDPHEREMQRGLEQSPEKLSKRTKSAKFARGGLADRARVQFGQRRTSQSLWQASLELDLRANRRSPPDMRFRVTSILDACSEADHLRALHPPCLALLRCSIMPEFRQEETMLLLNFDAASGAAALRFQKPSDLQVGKEIFLWKPWHTLHVLPELAESLCRSDCIGEAAPTGQIGDPRTVLFCTRFWLAPF